MSFTLLIMVLHIPLKFFITKIYWTASLEKVVDYTISKIESRYVLEQLLELQPVFVSEAGKNIHLCLTQVCGPAYEWLVACQW